MSEKNALMLFIFGTVTNHNKDLMHAKYTLAVCQNVEITSIISENLYVCSVNKSGMNQWILFMLGTMINNEVLCTYYFGSVAK